MKTLKLKDFIKVVNKESKIRISIIGFDGKTFSVYNEKAFSGLVKQVKDKKLLDLQVTQVEFFCEEWLVWTTMITK